MFDPTSLSRIRPYRTRRFSSFDRTGGNVDCHSIPSGETLRFVDFAGSGSVTHIWITINSPDPLIRRNLIVRMFWDGQDHPSVECPIGEFFGQGWGLKYEWMSALLAAAPKEGNALVSYLPMPFGSHARIEFENRSDHPVESFYCYLDIEERPVGDDEGRFHAQFRQELTDPDDGDKEQEWCLFGPYSENRDHRNNYRFCYAEGAGHFLGVNYFVNCPTPLWYGEGDDMFVVDGEAYPYRHHGTGTEDYFNQSWCPDTVYMHPFFGTARAPGRGNDDARFGWLGRTHCYRFHVTDPIRFSKSLDAGIEHGHANGLCLDLCTVAYWYQTLPSLPLEPLPPREALVPREVISPVDVHRWRDAWRATLGRTTLYGTERTVEDGA